MSSPEVERTEPDYVAPILLSLSFACFLFVCLLFRFRAGGIEEAEESKLFALGWLTIPATTLLLARYVGPGIGRFVDGNPFFRSTALVAHAAYWYLFTSSLQTQFPGGTVSPIGDDLGPPLRFAILWFLLGNVILCVLGAALRWFQRGQALARAVRSVVDLLLPFCICAICVPFANRAAPPWTPFVAAFVLGLGALAFRRSPAEPAHKTSWAFHALVCLLIALVVYNPCPDIDRESHNYYLGPVAAIFGGKTPLVDVSCQYGVGVIYFIALTMKLHLIAPSMSGFAKLITSAYVVHYCILYGLFLVTTRRVAIAVASIFLVILVCNFGQQDFPTMFPSVGPLRFVWGYLVLVAVALRGRFPERPKLATAVECVSLGVASIWSLESFVYASLAYAGVVLFESVNAVDRAALFARWRRVGLVVATIAAAHVLLTIATLLRAHSWPHWGLYLGYIALYTKGGFGQLPIATWTPWPFIVGVYLLSLLAFGYRRLVLGRRVDGAEATLIFGATALGIAQFTYFLGRSHRNNLFHVCTPALLVAVAWISWAAAAAAASDGKLRGASKAFRASVAYAAVAAGCFLAFSSLDDYFHKFDHSMLSFVTKPREVTPLTLDPRAVDAERLILTYSPSRRRVVLITAPDAEVEALLAIGRAEVWPIGYSPEDAILPEAAEAVARFVAPVVEDDVVFLDVSGSGRDLALPRGQVDDAPVLASSVSPMERTLFEHLRSRFAFRIVEQTSSGLMAARLVARK